VRVRGCLLRFRAGCAGEVEVLKGEEFASGGVEDVGCYGPGVVGDNHQLGAVGAGVNDRIDRGERSEEVVVWLQGSRGVDFVGVEGAVGGDDAFIEAVEVLALGVELQPGRVGAAASHGVYVIEAVLVVGVLEVQGGDVARVGGDVELGCRGCNGQRRGGECLKKHDSIMEIVGWLVGVIFVEKVGCIKKNNSKEK